MRIGCLQFAPQVGDVDNNLNRADSVLSKANPEGLDLLVLPELAFSGYNFKSLQQISPFLEPSGSGITSLWARTTALKYNCKVVAGYPEKVDVSGSWPTGPEYYNSAIVVNEDGETIANYRKSFLYYTDETWALEGPGFYEGYIPGLGRTCIGVVLTIKSPYKFEAPWHAFEFGVHVLQYDSDLVIVSMAWMTREDGRMFSRMPNEPDMDTLTYWITRLEPLIRAESKDEIIVIFCNRTGIEDDAVYAGTSAVVGIQDGEVKIYGLLGRGEKELLVVDTKNPPYAKLVHRPEPDRPLGIHSELQKASDSPSSPNATTSSTSPSDRHTPNQGTFPPGGFSAASYSLYKSPEKQPTAKQARIPPNIKIPPSYGPRPVILQGESADSPGSENANLPTPTAPSPTPLSERPKLTIPPPSLIDEWLPDSPVPQSAQSSRSIQSVQSIHTVTSNPRPPEDSTPYPHSGLPLSGYPTRVSNRRIFDDFLTMNQAPFTPITPFEETSPTEPRYFWRPADSLLKTPMSPELRTAVQEYDDTRTRSFGNFSRFPQDEPFRAHSSNSIRTTSTAIAAKPPDSASKNSRRTPSQKRAPSQPRMPRNSSRTSITKFTTGNVETLEDTSLHDGLLIRPSSPKSRNASRRRSQERSNSLSHRDITVEVSRQLESISRRAESVGRKGSFTEGIESSQSNRPSSSKSRSCSRGRPSGKASSILAAAGTGTAQNPTVKLQNTSHSTHQRTKSLSNMSVHSRTGSTTGSQREAFSRSRTPSVGEQSLARPASRATSRGRRPGPVFSPPRMVPRDPSQPAEEAQRDWDLFLSQGNNSSASKEPHASHFSEPIARFERVEALVSLSCPVHGRNSTSSTPSGHRVASVLSSSRSNSTPAATASSKSKGKERSVSSTIGDDLLFSPGSLAESIATISSSRSPSTPRFEPQTPRAMVLIRENEDIGTGEPPLLHLANNFSDLSCIERPIGSSSDESKAVTT
ncbi:N-terminal amidase [Colletotrichum truncatum]|uniref:N-terminal amidase n=1 Tax=Colletotrichum truncatum TaxID=5467 RepID=A0ACC3ZIK5_COLTU|nr:N-terminal amidase [Colletotrichum truncatum]KAF6791793.1 N-terminal amidase [Colletotrichum truncatum]